MLTRMLHRLAAPVLIAGLLIGLGGAPAMAGGSASHPKYCATLVTPATAAETGAPGVTCSATSAADARAALPAAAAAKVLLMTVYSDAQFRGSTLNFYGGATCDDYGYDYALTRYDDWAKKASSIRGYQNCNTVGVQSIRGAYRGTYKLSWSFGGTVYNDNMNAIHLFLK